MTKSGQQHGLHKREKVDVSCSLGLQSLLSDEL